MRRVLALVALAAVLFPVAACGDNSGAGGDSAGGGSAANGDSAGGGDSEGGGGGESTEEVCDSLQQASLTAAGELRGALVGVTVAASLSDQGELDAALAELQAIAEDFVQVYRDHAARAADAALSQALEAVATEVEALVTGFAEYDPGSVSAPDPDAFEAATNQVNHVCGW